jgi:catechol 2,3-dioxygenase
MTGTIDPATSLGAVTLTVADLETQAAFYQDAIGLRELRRDRDTVELGAPGGGTLVVLVGRPDSSPRPPRTSGLFHLALLVPSRPELARALRRVTAAGHAFSGASDHLVSEALYLDDPEGNGIEIYRDRPREEWAYTDGRLQMATLPLDVEGVLASDPGAAESAGGMPAGTRIGHVHLQVGSIPAADEFYVGALGFEPTVRGYRGALFVSAGGYHHHVGLNTWAGQGLPAPPAGSRGLQSFTIVLSSAAELARTLAAAADAGAAVSDDGGGASVADPSGNRVVLTSR